ncbi:MAG: hypothetical protein ACLPYZ_08675 [Limisphaerales bacterium]
MTTGLPGHRAETSGRRADVLASQTVIHVGTLPDTIWRYGSGGNGLVGWKF